MSQMEPEIVIADKSISGTAAVIQCCGRALDEVARRREWKAKNFTTI
jgi:hypothetical protein